MAGSSAKRGWSAIATKHRLQDMLSLHRELNLNVIVMGKYLETKKGIPDRKNGIS